MPTFTAVCASRTTGKDYRVAVDAPTKAAAMDQLSREGHIVGSVIGPDDPAPPPAPTPADDRLAAIHTELMALRRSFALRHPMLSVALGIILAGIILFIIAVLFQATIIALLMAGNPD